MENKKSIWVIFVKPHHRGKDEKRLKEKYRNILNQLINSDMYVFDIEYTRLSGENYDPESVAVSIIDEIDDFFFNPYALPEIDKFEKDDEDLDEIEKLIRESQKMYSDAPNPDHAEEKSYPDGKFIHVHVVSNKKLYIYMCEVLAEYGFEEEGIDVHAFESSYKLFSEFQMNLMRPQIRKRRDGGAPTGLLGEISLD